MMIKTLKLAVAAAAFCSVAPALADEPSHLLGHAGGGDQNNGISYGGIQSRDYQQVAAARAFVGAGRFDAALALLQPLSSDGFAPAQTLLGSMYALGRGVERDPAQAAQLYALAAHGGDAYAMYLYGYALDNGVGVAQDRDIAMMWMQRASDSGKIELMKAVRRYREGLAG
jgi:TPR repeat protein